MNTINIDTRIGELMAAVQRDEISAAQAIRDVDRVLRTFRRVGLSDQEDAYKRKHVPTWLLRQRPFSSLIWSYRIPQVSNCFRKQWSCHLCQYVFSQLKAVPIQMSLYRH